MYYLGPIAFGWEGRGLGGKMRKKERKKRGLGLLGDGKGKNNKKIMKRGEWVNICTVHNP